MYISLQEDDINRTLGLSKAITSFLEGLTNFREEIIQFNATLRIGLFYLLSETVVCPVILNRETVKILHQFNLSLDITGYPCSDEDM